MPKNSCKTTCCICAVNDTKIVLLKGHTTHELSGMVSTTLFRNHFANSSSRLPAGVTVVGRMVAPKLLFDMFNANRATNYTTIIVPLVEHTIHIEGNCDANCISSVECHDTTPPIGSFVPGCAATEVVVKNSILRTSEPGGKSFRAADVDVDTKAVVCCTTRGKITNVG